MKTPEKTVAGGSSDVLVEVERTISVVVVASAVIVVVVVIGVGAVRVVVSASGARRWRPYLCVAPLLGCLNTSTCPLVVDDTVRAAHVAVLGDLGRCGHSSRVEACWSVSAGLVRLRTARLCAGCSGGLCRSGEDTSCV